LLKIVVQISLLIEQTHPSVTFPACNNYYWLFDADTNG